VASHRMNQEMIVGRHFAAMKAKNWGAGSGLTHAPRYETVVPDDYFLSFGFGASAFGASVLGASDFAVVAVAAVFTGVAGVTWATGADVISVADFGAPLASTA
jgi:hypothetical protein